MENQASDCVKTMQIDKQGLYFQAVNCYQNKIENAVTGNFAQLAVTHPPDNAPIKHDVLSLGKTA
jgi:hypothetical protein